MDPLALPELILLQNIK